MLRRSMLLLILLLAAEVSAETVDGGWTLASSRERDGYPLALYVETEKTPGRPAFRVETRLGVEQHVVPEGHFAFLDLLPDLFELLAPLPLVIAAPRGEVEVLPRLRDVVGHEPGDRRHAAVPGPRRLVRVAVVARGAQHLRDPDALKKRVKSEPLEILRSILEQPDRASLWRLTRGLDSLILASLFTHEYEVDGIAPGVWRDIVAGVTAAVADCPAAISQPKPTRPERRVP